MKLAKTRYTTKLKRPSFLIEISIKNDLVINSPQASICDKKTILYSNKKAQIDGNHCE